MGGRVRSGIQHLCERRAGQRLVHPAIRRQRHSGCASGRILVAQLTTDGDISGQFRAQIFPGGDQENDVRADLSFVHEHMCSDLTIDVATVITPGDATGNYTITRTFTATDDANNSSQAVQVITVEDTTAPEFLFVPADITIECSSDGWTWC